MRCYREPRDGSARYARALAECLQACDDGDGVHFAPTDVKIAEKALRSYASRGIRRAKAIAVASLVGGLAILGVRDGNANGRADVFDYVAAASEISGFGAASATDAPISSTALKARHPALTQ